jgi:hypothetical protein
VQVGKVSEMDHRARATRGAARVLRTSAPRSFNFGEELCQK